MVSETSEDIGGEALDAVRFRDAVVGDLSAIVDLLADDDLGQTREDTRRPLNAAYREAFEAIDRDPNNRVIVAECGGHVVGCLQLTLIPNLSHTGMWRGQIEAVRVASTFRGRGLGAQLIGQGTDLARAAGCGMVQLTSNAQRTDARRFYERLGYVASHIGLKLKL